MYDYLFTFETDYGMEMVVIMADTLRAATAELKRSYPDDHGADGLVTLEDGTERPINW
jgi:hypothetical protein